MRIKELLTEGKNHPVIVVDVQPAYYSYNRPVCDKIIDFVANQTGPVLMFMNAEKDGLTEDTVYDVRDFWNQHTDADYTADGDLVGGLDWSRVTTDDKGFGYFRSWMSNEIPERYIIQLIRFMYQNKLNDIQDNLQAVKQFMTSGNNPIQWQYWMDDESFSINWTSVAQLKRFSGAYLVGGGRNECLKEVELLMNAFNIGYKRIDSLVY
jgi:hypothetical protein